MEDLSGGGKVDWGMKSLFERAFGWPFDMSGAATLCLWEGREGGRIWDGSGEGEFEIRDGRGRGRGENCSSSFE